jgi:peptidoglycan/LPS O-acetylase OafA/YrhL
LALDGLRGLAALSVLVFHVWLLSPEHPSFGARHGIAAKVAHEGRLGLFLFFVLSGFLLYRPVVAAGLDGARLTPLHVYLSRRAARILPAYYLALVGAVALLWHARGTPGVSLPPASKLWLFAVFGQNFSADTVLKLNGPLWTLAVEAAFYLALPLAALAAVRAGRDRVCQVAVPLAAIGMGLVWNAWCARRSHAPLTLTLQLPAMLPYFGSGMLAAVAVHGRRLHRSTAVRVLAFGLALVAVDAVWDGADSSSFVRHVVRDLPGAIGFALVIAAVANGERLRVLLANRVAVSLGAVSYGVYLWQVPVILGARDAGLLPQRPVLALLAVLPAVLGVAAISWFAVERPALRWVRRAVPADRASGAPVREDTAAPGDRLGSVATGASDRLRTAAGAAARLPAIAGVALIAVAARLAYGPPYAEYDASYMLIWGRDIAGGHLPADFGQYYSPTPHPLANLAGALLSPLGHGALPALELLALLALAALGVAALLLGTRLFGAPIGVVFAALLLTRPLVVKEALVASVDIPAMALVVGAAAVEAGQRRRPLAVLALLTAAGLLRPEIWLLSVAYAAFAIRRDPDGPRTAIAALALSAPVLWLAADAIVTGDALHSLHWTRFGADRLHRPRGLGHVVADGPRFLARLLQPAVLAAAVAGAALALWACPRRALLPLVTAALGCAAFAAIGVANLAVLQRYLLIPSAMALLLAAVALVGWRAIQQHERVRALWAGAAAVMALSILLATPADYRNLSRLATHARAMHRQDRDLRAIAPYIRSESQCGTVRVSNYRQKPLLAFLLRKHGSDVAIGPLAEARDGIVVAASRDANAPSGFRRVRWNSSWVVLERCSA